MNSKREWKIFGAMAAIFGLAYYLPLANPEVIDAILEAAGYPADSPMPAPAEPAVGAM